MFIADNVLFFPIKSILSIFKEIHKAALQERKDEAAAIRTELAQLYQRLESGELDDDAFDARESELLDRLDLLETRELEDESEQDFEDDSDEEFEDDSDEEFETEAENDLLDEADEEFEDGYEYEPSRDDTDCENEKVD